MVHPAYRNKGIGTALLRWSQERANTLMAGSIGQPVYQVSTECLTPPADRLYSAYGFDRFFEELVMQRDLAQPLPRVRLPADVVILSWKPELADKFYQAYYAAFQARPGFPGWSLESWTAHVTGDDYVRGWTLLALRNDALAGFVIGDINLAATPHRGYIAQVGVVPSQRGIGLAPALMVESMKRMAGDGIRTVNLAVNTNNPGAVQTYLKLGFQTIGTRARYEKPAA